MIGFGEKNSEFGTVPPSLISIEEIKEQGYATNSLLIELETGSGLFVSIRFHSYIMHLTRNESYTSWDAYEEREGNYLVDFTRSRLNDLYDDVIIHTDDYSWPGRGHHYGVYAVDHIIDILADCVPEIEVEERMQEIDSLEKAADLLSLGDVEGAKTVIKSNYPFSPVKREGRNYTVKQMMEQFCRDGFIDRYSGEKLINPGILRVFSELMPEEYPFQPHWKTDECHIAYWDYQPTVDHIYPVSLGGADSPENWASTSMINNSAKGNFTLKQFGWTLRPTGDMKEWDGLSRQFIEIVDANERLLAVKKIKEWYLTTKAVLGNH